MKNLDKKSKRHFEKRETQDGIRKRKLKPVPKTKYRQKAYDLIDEEE